MSVGVAGVCVAYPTPVLYTARTAEPEKLLDHYIPDCSFLNLTHLNVVSEIYRN